MFDSPQVKRKLISNIKNFEQELKYEKPENSVNTQLSTQSPIQKCILALAAQNHAKADLRVF